MPKSLLILQILTGYSPILELHSSATSDYCTVSEFAIADHLFASQRPGREL
jgi:hypothetical protein